MKDFVEVPNNNNVCIVQVLICIKLEHDIILCEETGALAIVEPGFMAGRQAVRQTKLL